MTRLRYARAVRFKKERFSLTKSFLFSIILTLLFPLISQADSMCRQEIPGGEIWHFARLILDDPTMSESQRVTNLREACRPLDSNHTVWSRINGYRPLNPVLNLIAFGPHAFSDLFRKIGGSERHDQYMEELNEIRKLPIASDRVRETYRLFLKYKKPYVNHEGLRTPNETLAEGGMCRDFARLLLFSLRHVKTSTSSSPQREQFSANLVNAWNPETKEGHTWVRVLLPDNDSGRRSRNPIYHRISLDPTNMKEGYTPLMPLGQNLAESRMDEYFGQCQQIASCLEGTDSPSNTESSPTAEGSNEIVR